MTTLLLQLSDLHIRELGQLAYGRIDTASYLKRAIETILRLPQQPDAVVITGDLTDFGRMAEYDHLGELLSPLAMPVYLIPGNHDDRNQLRSSFSQHHYLSENSASGPVNYAIQIGGLRLLALDTTVPGHSHGSLDKDQFSWLTLQLASSKSQPVVIAMHHPPFETGIGHMDDNGLRSGAEQLEALVAQHPNVERIICGHLHRAIDVRFGGSIASTAPSPAHQVCLDLSPQAASRWALEPPGFKLHALTSSGHLTSHTVPCGRFDGPYPFHNVNGLIH